MFASTVLPYSHRSYRSLRSNVRSASREEEEERPVAFIRPRVGEFRLCVPVTVPLIIAKRYLRQIAPTQQLLLLHTGKISSFHPTQDCRKRAIFPARRPQLNFFFFFLTRTNTNNQHEDQARNTRVPPRFQRAQHLRRFRIRHRDGHQRGKFLNVLFCRCPRLEKTAEIIVFFKRCFTYCLIYTYGKFTNYYSHH